MVDSGINAGLKASLLLLMLLPMELLAAIHLQLPGTLEQGRPLQAELVLTGQDHDLQTLSLQPLTKFFHIEESGEVQLTQEPQRQTRRLKLLPLDSGTFSLPEWGVENRLISPALDARTREPIAIRYQTPQHNPWQRQQVAYAIELETPQRFIRLKLGEPLDSNWLARLSEAHTEAIDQGPTARYRHRFVLWLFPLQPGHQTLQLPALSYLHDGVATHRFYPPPITLTVKALPAYLPASTQVGRIALQPLSSAYAMLPEGDNGELRLVIRADGVAAPLWSLALPELKQGTAIEPLPASGHLLETVSLDGVSSDYRLNLPFESRQSQFWSSQPVVLEYFDPVLGKRVTQTLSLETPWIISELQSWLLVLVVVGLMSWCLRLVVLWLQGQRRMAAAYLQAWSLLGSASEAGTLRQAQACIAEAEGWPSHMGIEAWRQHWQKLMPEQDLSAWQEGMQGLCYRGLEESLPGLRREMLLMMQKRLAWRLSWYRLLSLMGAL